MKEIVFKLGHLRHFDAEKNIKELKKQKKELLKDYKVVAALNDLGKKKVQLDNTVSWIENTLEEINWDWENEGKQLIQFIDDSIGLVTKLKKQEKLNYTLNFYSLKGKIFRKLEDFKNAEIEINNYFELANECFSNEKASDFLIDVIQSKLEKALNFYELKVNINNEDEITDHFKINVQKTIVLFEKYSLSLMVHKEDLKKKDLFYGAMIDCLLYMCLCYEKIESTECWKLALDELTSYLTLYDDEYRFYQLLDSKASFHLCKGEIRNAIRITMENLKHCKKKKLIFEENELNYKISQLFGKEHLYDKSAEYLALVKPDENISEEEILNAKSKMKVIENTIDELETEKVHLANLIPSKDYKGQFESRKQIFSFFMKLEYFEDAKSTLESIQKMKLSDDEFLFLYENFGDVYAILKKFEDSEKYYQKALCYSTKNFHRGEILIKLGNVLIKKKNFSESFLLYKTLKSVGISENNLEFQKIALEKCNELYSSMSKNFSYFKKFLCLEDKLKLNEKEIIIQRQKIKEELKDLYKKIKEQKNEDKFDGSDYDFSDEELEADSIQYSEEKSSEEKNILYASQIKRGHHDSSGFAYPIKENKDFSNSKPKYENTLIPCAKNKNGVVSEDSTDNNEIKVNHELKYKASDEMIYQKKNFGKENTFKYSKEHFVGKTNKKLFQVFRSGVADNSVLITCSDIGTPKSMKWLAEKVRKKYKKLYPDENLQILKFQNESKDKDYALNSYIEKINFKQTFDFNLKKEVIKIFAVTETFQFNKIKYI